MEFSDVNKEYEGDRLQWTIFFYIPGTVHRYAYNMQFESNLWLPTHITTGIRLDVLDELDSSPKPLLPTIGLVVFSIERDRYTAVLEDYNVFAPGNGPWSISKETAQTHIEKLIDLKNRLIAKGWVVSSSEGFDDEERVTSEGEGTV